MTRPPALPSKLTPTRAELAAVRCSCGLEIREYRRSFDGDRLVCAHGHVSRVDFVQREGQIDPVLIREEGPDE